MSVCLCMCVCMCGICWCVFVFCRSPFADIRNPVKHKGNRLNVFLSVFLCFSGTYTNYILLFFTIAIILYFRYQSPLIRISRTLLNFPLPKWENFFLKYHPIFFLFFLNKLVSISYFSLVKHRKSLNSQHLSTVVRPCTYSSDDTSSSSLPFF